MKNLRTRPSRPLLSFLWVLFVLPAGFLAISQPAAADQIYGSLQVSVEVVEVCSQQLSAAGDLTVNCSTTNDSTLASESTVLASQPTTSTETGDGGNYVTITY